MLSSLISFLLKGKNNFSRICFFVCFVSTVVHLWIWAYKCNNAHSLSAIKQSFPRPKEVEERGKRGAEGQGFVSETSCSFPPTLEYLKRGEILSFFFHSSIIIFLNLQNLCCNFRPFLYKQCVVRKKYFGEGFGIVSASCFRFMTMMKASKSRVCRAGGNTTLQGSAPSSLHKISNDSHNSRLIAREAHIVTDRWLSYVQCQLC